ncbi:flagellar assembly protein FliX [Maritalea mediterranea]|uniref:Flagellar assembly protein FliX n=1 Tax=Maritalea mediterranea TaxID=2909667 RepID=A0ABS9E7K1_9HYPH|nr:flagellar assembly protein FliX [Maritalea mediterranea]MCF4098822.1 flagellar assembly protein FliX [Maritalea mediterranea]
MRITDTNRTSRTAPNKTAKGRGQGETFSVEQEKSAGQARHSAGVEHVGSVDALLALQSVEDPTLAKKKSVKRGHQLLDGLERLKTDLLVGRVSEARLQNMHKILKNAPTTDDPALKAVIDDIELRVQVELAKLGRL